MGEMNLHYTGTVQIRYRYKKKVRKIINHNIGLPPLFRFWARALVGENVSGEIPCKLDLRESQNDISWVSILKNPIPITSLTYMNENDSWVNKITSTISYDQFIDHSLLNDNNRYKIVLSSQIADLAELEVPASDLLAISDGTQAIVDWTLKISN